MPPPWHASPDARYRTVRNEGDNTNSDTWFAEHVTPSVFSEVPGQARNGCELWREDVELAAGMGLHAHRFSVEWARVEPTEGTFDGEALPTTRRRFVGNLIRAYSDLAGNPIDSRLTVHSVSPDRMAFHGGPIPCHA